jgi:hypothetical protein
MYMSKQQKRADSRMDKLKGQLGQLIMRGSDNDCMHARMSKLEGMVGELLMCRPGRK